MRLHQITYLGKSGLRNLLLGRLMTVASVGSLTACLLMIGAAVLAASLLRTMLREVGSRQQIVLYLENEGNQGRVEQLEVEILAVENVRRITYASREENLMQMSKKLGETPENLLYHPGADNPFLATYTVQIEDVDLYSETRERLLQLEGVSAAKGSQENARMLSETGRAVLRAWGGIAFLLATASVVVVSNTIRMTIHARRKEIEIMRMVGATAGFIRFPFLVEAILTGGLSAGLAWSILYIGCHWLEAYLPVDNGYALQLLAQWVNTADVIWPALLVLFLLMGIGCGLLGASSLAGRYLKV